MTPAETTPATTRAALDWLAAAAPDQDTCRAAWQHSTHRTVHLTAGPHWDVLSVPAPLGRAALAVLERLHDHGPVISDPDGDRLRFLVPPGTADHWTGTGIRTTPAGTLVAVPHPAARTRGLHWLVPPDGTGRLVDPARLELALHDAAAGLTCRSRRPGKLVP